MRRTVWAGTATTSPKSGSTGTTLVPGKQYTYCVYRLSHIPCLISIFISSDLARIRNMIEISDRMTDGNNVFPLIIRYIYVFSWKEIIFLD